ncbi:MAG: hypothetical protein GY757_40705 [bacterium]|nr:hypothetical protein [bacterium]
MTNATIYTINQTGMRDQLEVAEAAKVNLTRTYTGMTVIKAGDKQFLLGYDKVSGQTDSYLLTSSDPWLEPVDNALEFKKGWDRIEPFYMADKPHMCCYQSKNGHLYFFPLSEELKTSPPLHFYHTRYPYTTDLTEVKPLVSQGQVFVIGYNGENGYVNFWTVSATAHSAGEKPPLVVNSAWAHQWAKGWTRFAFFIWGNENYFLKTNTWKPNVNIDHISDVLSSGTNEVGSHLKLKDDQKLNIVHPFMVGNGEPYFLTYLADTGESTFNRIHGDCLGWSTCAVKSCAKDVTQIVPYRIGDTNFALYA